MPSVPYVRSLLSAVTAYIYLPTELAVSLAMRPILSMRPCHGAPCCLLAHGGLVTLRQLNGLEFAVNGPDLKQPTTRKALCLPFVIGVSIIIEVHLETA